MWLSNILARKRRKNPRDWVGQLSEEQRRVLASNLRDLTESKQSLERRLNPDAPRP
jgi:hypothetical protein